MKRAFLFLCVAVLSAAGSGEVPASAPDTDTVATFSIVACDTARGEWGVAVASRFLGVGAVVPWAQAGVGAVATQAMANTGFGPDGLKLLSAGYTAQAAIERLLERDGQPAIRQLGVVDRSGGSATFTGQRCLATADGIQGPGFAVQGNSLSNGRVLPEMAEVFIRHGDKPLAERLLLALEAGQSEGGDSRGKQAAAILVVKRRGGFGGHNDRYVDLRVDDHGAPVQELKRLYTLHAKSLLPGVHARLGDEALAEGRREEADAEFARAVTLYRDAILKFPEDPEPCNGLAWFYVKHNMNIDEAWAMARRAYDLDPDSWQVLDTLAELYYATGNMEKAHKASRAALERDPENRYLMRQEQRFRDASSDLR